MGKKERLIERVLDLSETDKNTFKILYHNHIEWVYDEIENNEEIIPTITNRTTNETHNVFEYIEDKTNVINSTYYLSGIRRKP